MWGFHFCCRLQLPKRLWCLFCSQPLFCVPQPITIKRHSICTPLAIHQQLYPTSVIGIIIMDREYIQYLKQETVASAKRAVSRAVAVTIYGVAGVYLLSTIMADVVPKVAAILPLGSNAVGYQDEGVNLSWDWQKNVSMKWCGNGSGNRYWRYTDAGENTNTATRCSKRGIGSQYVSTVRTTYSDVKFKFTIILNCSQHPNNNIHTVSKLWWQCDCCATHLDSS